MTNRLIDRFPIDIQIFVADPRTINLYICRKEVRLVGQHGADASTEVRNCAINSSILLDSRLGMFSCSIVTGERGSINLDLMLRTGFSRDGEKPKLPSDPGSCGVSVWDSYGAT